MKGCRQPKVSSASAQPGGSQPSFSLEAAQEPAWLPAHGIEHSLWAQAQNQLHTGAGGSQSSGNSSTSTGLSAATPALSWRAAPSLRHSESPPVLQWLSETAEKEHKNGASIWNESHGILKAGKGFSRSSSPSFDWIVTPTKPELEVPCPRAGCSNAEPLLQWRAFLCSSHTCKDMNSRTSTYPPTGDISDDWFVVAQVGRSSRYKLAPLRNMEFSSALVNALRHY